jgi:hypothetical protein
MAFKTKNLHLYQTLERGILLQKNGFYRQKTHNSDKYTGQMSDCKANLVTLISQASLFCRKICSFTQAANKAKKIFESLSFFVDAVKKIL